MKLNKFVMKTFVPGYFLFDEKGKKLYNNGEKNGQNPHVTRYILNKGISLMTGAILFGGYMIHREIKNLPEKEQRLIQQFQKIDKNNDGKIKQDEYLNYYLK